MIKRVRLVTHLDDWRARLDPNSGAAAQARERVVAYLEELGFADAIRDVVLIVSELVTNALKHGSPPILLLVEAQ